MRKMLASGHQRFCVVAERCGRSQSATAFAAASSAGEAVETSTAAHSEFENGAFEGLRHNRLDNYMVVCDRGSSYCVRGQKTILFHDRTCCRALKMQVAFGNFSLFQIRSAWPEAFNSNYHTCWKQNSTPPSPKPPYMPDLLRPLRVSLHSEVCNAKQFLPLGSTHAGMSMPARAKLAESSVRKRD